MDHPTIAISGDEPLDELAARARAALPVLQRFGLDTCCGGALSLATAAGRHGLELSSLLAALRKELWGADTEAPAAR